MSGTMKKVDNLKDIVKQTAIQMRETDRRMQETDRMMKEQRLSLKKLEDLFTTQWGKLIEALTEGSLIELLRSQNIDVVSTYTRLTGVYKDKRREFDIIAANGNEVVVVEVKTTLRPDDVKYFLEIMEDFKNLCSAHRDSKVYGAVAFIKAVCKAEVYAERQGLFVIRSAGKNAVLMNQKGFRPRELI